MVLKGIVRQIYHFLHFNVRQCLFSILEYKVFLQATHTEEAQLKWQSVTAMQAFSKVGYFRGLIEKSDTAVCDINLRYAFKI